MKTQNRRKAGRSEEAYLCSWNNFISFISRFQLVGVILLAPGSLISYCPCDLNDGLLVDYWTQSFVVVYLYKFPGWFH
jgi:hypothetical protein